MSGTTPNTANIALVRGPVAIANQLVTHPEYQYWRVEWSKVRDCLAGQREIKRKGAAYLPKLKGADNDDYEQYLSRAVFYNMTSQTQNGMLGQIFRRDPKIDGVPARLAARLKRICKDGTGIVNFTKTVVSEQIALGRFGVLADLPATESNEPDPYLVGYTAENILDWTFEEIEGRFRLTRVLLREFVRKNDARFFSPYTYDTLYRELRLVQTADGLVYIQNTYFDQAPPVETSARTPGAPSPQSITQPAFVNGQQVPHPGVPQPVSSVTPTIRGATLDYIPFVFFGAFSNSTDVEKPPLLDIADLNISHYRSYAELEHGRFYVAMPVYYAPGRDDESAAEYNIGPNLVWEVPEGERPGILEFSGKGLNELSKALEDKERQIAAIGGRLLSGGTKGGETDNQANLRQANEFSLLLNVIQAAECGMALVMRYWMAFADVSLAASEDFIFRINTDFLQPSIGARELRAIQLMYEAGVVGVDVLYNYLLKADVIPPTTSYEDFKASLASEDFFPGQPDVTAARRGFSSRQQELDQARIAREEDFQQQEIDLQEREVELAEKAAKDAAAKPPPGPVPSAPALAPATPKPGTAAGKKPAGAGKLK